MSNRASIFLLIIPFLAFSSCKKYPEEGSHQRARHKIIGIWELKQIFIDNADSSSSTGYSRYIAKYEFESNMWDVNFRCTDTINGIHCYWDLKKSRKKLHFGYDKCKDKDACSGGIFDYGSSDWDILILTDSKMKLKAKSSMNNSEYILILEK